MNTKKEWLRCSAVAAGFYLIVYVLLGTAYFGLDNPWLIGIIIVLTIGDVFGLRWIINRSNEEDSDHSS